jgi:hypothetical protein
MAAHIIRRGIIGTAKVMILGMLRMHYFETIIVSGLLIISHERSQDRSKLYDIFITPSNVAHGYCNPLGDRRNTPPSLWLPSKLARKRLIMNCSS